MPPYTCINAEITHRLPEGELLCQWGLDTPSLADWSGSNWVGASAVTLQKYLEREICMHAGSPELSMYLSSGDSRGLATSQLPEVSGAPQRP